MDFEIQPAEFSLLRKGGPENGHMADALVFQNGRTWTGSGLTWRKVAFRQAPWGPSHAPALPAAARARSR